MIDSHSWFPTYLRILKIMSPQRPDFILTTDIPHCEADVFVLDRFDVEALNQINSSDYYHRVCVIIPIYNKKIEKYINCFHGPLGYKSFRPAGVIIIQPDIQQWFYNFLWVVWFYNFLQTFNCTQKNVAILKKCKL